MVGTDLGAFPVFATRFPCCGHLANRLTERKKDPFPPQETPKIIGPSAGFHCYPPSVFATKLNRFVAAGREIKLSFGDGVALLTCASMQARSECYPVLHEPLAHRSPSAIS